MHVSHLFIHSPFDGHLGSWFFGYNGHFYTSIFMVRGKFIALSVETRKDEFRFE